jgi:hypothetical protein
MVRCAVRITRKPRCSATPGLALSRIDWFEHLEGPAVALWWVPAGHRPSVEEALARLEHLKQHGPGDHAFDWHAASAQLWKTARCAPAGQVA